MRYTRAVVLALFVGCCLGAGCDRGKDTPPGQTGPRPGVSEKTQLPKRVAKKR